MLKAARIVRLVSFVPVKDDAGVITKQRKVTVTDSQDTEYHGSLWPSPVPRKFVPPPKGRGLEARLKRKQKRKEVE